MNSEALRISGLDETVPDPTGGFFEKDKDGKLTGYLSGQPAFLPYKAYPNATHEAAVEKSKLSAKFGVTTGSELAIMNAFVLEAVHEAVQDPEYATRLIGGYFSTAPDYKEIVPLLKNYETDLFRIPFIKTWTDGSLQGGTAYLRHGYHDKTMGEGDSAQGSQEYFNELVLDIYQRGFWPAIHANGDGAVDVALNALENAKKKMGPARKTSSGRVVGASQAITPEQALAAYTINAAYQFGMEKDVGSLEVGKFADFVVLDSNPIKIDPLKIRDIQIVATVMGGRITYSDTPPYDRVTPIKW